MCLWQDHHFSTYDKTICTTCRLKLEKKYNNNENHLKCGKVFEWIYDLMTVFTPETTKSTIEGTSDDSFRQSHEASDQKKSFFDWLKSQGFKGRTERTLSYTTLKHHSRTKYVSFLKKCLIMIIIPI
jgi:hypothetical protein